MGVKFSNNATTTLAAGISASDLSITLPAGHGARFPALLAGDWFYLTLIDASGNMEIVKVTGRATDVLTVSRAAEGTSARAFSIGTTVSHRLTAQGLQDYGNQLMGAGHMFTVYWWPGSRAGIPAGCVPADGQTLTRALYPDAYAEIAAGKMPVVTEAAWSADPLQRGAYTLGDGSTTFRMPDYNGKQPGSIGAVFLRGDGVNSSGTAGTLQGDAIRNITGALSPNSDGAEGGWFGSDGGSGALAPRSTNASVFVPTLASNPSGRRAGISFDASRIVPTASENRPINVTGCWIIKLFGAVTNAGSLDAAALNTSKLDKTVFYDRAGTSGALSWRNKIINGNFDVWQRGTSVTPPNALDTFLADRFSVFSNTGSKTVYSKQSCLGTEPFTAKSYLRVVNTGMTSTDGCQISHRIEDARVCDGKTLTLSFWAKADSVKKMTFHVWRRFNATDGTTHVTAPIAKVFDLTTNWQKFTHTFTIPASVYPAPTYTNVSMTELGFKVSADADTVSTYPFFAPIQGQSGTFDVAQIQLEEGTVATPFEHRPYSVELALCQRYYQLLTAGFGIVGSSTVVHRFTMPFVVPMRAVPSLLLPNTPTPEVQTGTTGARMINALATQYSSTQNAQVDLIIASTTAAAGQVVTSASWSESACIRASAEL